MEKVQSAKPLGSLQEERHKYETTTGDWGVTGPAALVQGLDTPGQLHRAWCEPGETVGPEGDPQAVSAGQQQGELPPSQRCSRTQSSSRRPALLPGGWVTRSSEVACGKGYTGHWLGTGRDA